MKFLYYMIILISFLVLFYPQDKELWGDFLRLDQQGLANKGSKKTGDTQNKDVVNHGKNPSLFQGDSYPEHIVRNLRAIVLKDDPSAVQITWQFKYPAGVREYSIFRSNEAILSPEDLFRADVVGIVGSQELKIIDAGLDPGKYYYAVIAKDQVIGKNPELYVNINTTGEPAYIRDFKLNHEALNPKAHIINLHAEYYKKNDQAVAILRWDSNFPKEVLLKIYRSENKIEVEKDLQDAEVIAEISANLSKYADYTLPEKGEFFYALTSVFKIADKEVENKTIIAGVNTTLVPLKDLDEKHINSIFVHNLKIHKVTQNSASVKNANRVKIHWDKNENIAKDYSLRIYHSNQKFANILDQNKAELMYEGKADITEYLLDPFYLNSSKPNYFAVILGNPVQKSWNYRIIAGRNSVEYTSSPDEKKQISQGDGLGYSSVFSEIQSYPVKDGILLRWQFQQSIPAKFKDATVYLIRSHNRHPSFDTLKKEGIIVLEFSLPKKLSGFTDNNLDTLTPYYYTLVLGPRSDYVFDMTFEPGINILKNSVLPSANSVKRNGEKSSPLLLEKSSPARNRKLIQINNILNDHFYNGEYLQTYKLLEPFLNSGDKVVKSKALLFRGRSLYSMNRFQQALPYFLDKDVLTYFKDEAVFWRQAIYKRIQ